MKHINYLRRQGFLLLFCLVPLWAFSQTITIKGVVKDTTGEPLIGANVLQKDTQNGTITDLDGKFSLTVERNTTLVVSYIGYIAQEVSTGEGMPLTITLQEDINVLQDVVVIGYGTQRREAITGSVANIGGDVMREVPAGNITQALQGRVAGVNMAQTSTKPGTTMQIRIRGTRSINASNDPLIVLDGIPFAGTISDISPEDIKSIDILKDASATAIYGSRGANGVVLVTSYSGFKGQKAQVSYSGYMGWKNAIKYPMMNGAEYAALRERAAMNNAGTDEPVDANGKYTVDTDWQDMFFRTGIVTNHDVSVMGGTETGSYKFGAGYYNDQAVVPLSYYNRYSIRGSLDQQIGILRVGFSTNNNFNITNGDNIGMYGVLSMSPVADPYNPDGTQRRLIHMPQDTQWLYSRESMDALEDQYANQTKAFGSYNSFYAEVAIPGVEGLKARVNLGANYRQSNSGSYQGVYTFSGSETGGQSNASISNSLTYSWANENLITYDRIFNDKHSLNVVALFSAEQTHYSRSAISRRNIASDAFQYFNLGNSSTSLNDDITIDPNQQHYELYGLMSYMGRAMYTYDNRYMISATLRSDGSSRLAPGYKWHTYPAISAGWNIGNESFMKDNVSWVDELKIRLGFGQTSNQSVNPYSTLGKLSTVPYNFGSTGYATGYRVESLPNPLLGWEYSTTINAGLDFTFFDGRLSGTFEYYSTRTKDLLLSVNLPPTSGVNSYMGNVGETSNKGWELTLDGTIIKTKDWQWDAGINFSGNKNKIVKLNSGRTEDVDNWLFVGHPLNVIYDYKNIGIWQEGDPYLDILEPGESNKPGMIKVQYTGEYDAEGKPVRLIGADDMQVQDADPNFVGGFNTRVAYKGIDLTIVGTFQNGGILNSTLYGSNGYLNLEDGRRGQIQIDYWTEDNTDAKFPDPNGPKNSNNPKYGSTLGYFSGTFLKIGTATLGYNFDPQLTRKIGIEKLRVYFTAQNPLVLFSPYHRQSGMDPQTNSYANDGGMMAVAYSGNLSRLLNVGYNSPSTRNYMIGLNVTF